MGKVILEIFRDEDVVKDSIIRLRLVNGIGSVCVAAVNRNGDPIDCGHIVGFRMGKRRLVVWGETQEKEPIRLRLVQEDGDIMLQLVDAEGRAYLHGGIGDQLPVLTDENGRMIVG